MRPAIQQCAGGHSPPYKPAGSRAGMSLLELMLVLGLLVVIAALAAPSLERPLEAERLRRAAQLVQSEWGKARIRAMQSGQTMVFQYQPASGRYRVQPWVSDDLALESGAAADPADPTALDPTMADTAGIPKELPEGIEFYDSITLSETRSLEIEEELSQLSRSTSAENSWSAPVLFFPDGTATTTEMMLSNQTGSYITLRLRGLTGVAHASDVLSTGTGEPLQ